LNQYQTCQELFVSNAIKNKGKKVKEGNKDVKGGEKNSFVEYVNNKSKENQSSRLQNTNTQNRPN